MGWHWIVVFVCIHTYAAAQNPADSLLALLHDAQRKNQFDREAYFAYQLGSLYSQQRQFDSALHYFNTSLKPGASDVLRASSYNSKGGVYDKLGLPDSSIYFYQQSQALYEKLQDTVSLVIVETNLSAIYMTKGVYDKAMEYAFQSLDKLEKKPASRALASCYNTLASIYRLTGDVSTSLDYHRKALLTRQHMAYGRGIGQSFNNMGETFVQLHQFDSALKYLVLAKQVKDSLKEKAAPTLNNLGEVHMQLGNTTEAEIFLKRALDLNLGEGNVLGQIENFNNMAKLSLLKKDLLSCEHYLTRAESLLARTDALENQRENLELFIALSKAQSRPERALLYAEKLAVVRDRILTKQKIESLAAMQIKYESEKKEQQISLLSHEKEIQQANLTVNRLMIRGLTGMAILLTVIAGLVWNQYRLARKSRQRVETLLRELNHRVKNNLQLLSSILTLQSHQLTDETAIKAIKSNESRINAMALIHTKLYGPDVEQSIKLNDYITELVNYLVQTFGFGKDQIALSLEVEDLTIHIDKGIPLGLILNELITNSFKYAFDDGHRAGLRVTLRRQQGVGLIITIEDNGKGYPNTVDLAAPTTFGLRMVMILVKELNGQLRLSNRNGANAELIIPYPT